jgi:hypothetical protein
LVGHLFSSRNFERSWTALASAGTLIHEHTRTNTNEDENPVSVISCDFVDRIVEWYIFCTSSSNIFRRRN